jgi:hypothetical protein
MEQRILMKIAFENGLNAMQTYQKLVDHYVSDVLSYLSVTAWRREFCGGRKHVEDSPRSGNRQIFEFGSMWSARWRQLEMIQFAAYQRSLATNHRRCSLS